MNLNVFVGERRVATLTSPDGFEHVLAYLPETPEADFVSLTMPVAQGAWRWPALHPFFQVSLPEGFLLSVLKERLGPHLGATPLELLSVVGHNMIGRVRVSAGERPAPEAALGDLAPLLHGKQSQAVFMELLAEYAVSGVSGVVPKFLTPQTRALFRSKGTLATERHIVKASAEHQPFVALNEHLCMQAAARCRVPVADTRVSDDGQVLVVERFDIDPVNRERRGFEDFCSLLGLSPEQKYDSTWERVARLVREYVAPERRRAAQRQLAVTLLLSCALGNADCHTKNLAFVYTNLDDVEVAPIYDMLSILAYDRYAGNPPGLYIDGRKRWDADKAIWRFLQQHLGLEPAAQRALVDEVCTAVDGMVPELEHRIRHTPGFEPVGLRMLWEWNEGMKRLQQRRTFALPDWVAAFSGDRVRTPADNAAPPACRARRPRRGSAGTAHRARR